MSRRNTTSDDDGPEWVSAKGPGVRSDSHNWRPVNDEQEPDDDPDPDPENDPLTESSGPEYTCPSCGLEEHIKNLDQDYLGRPQCPDCNGHME